MISSLISLKDSSSWDPATIIKHSVQWPNGTKIVRLRDVSLAISPVTWVKRGTQVITSSSIDVRYGHVFQRSRNFEGTGFQVSDGSDQLSVGDILIPLRLETPVLLLGNRHSGAIVSDDFFAIKAISRDWATWMWAALNSSIGMKLRAVYLADSTTRTSKIRSLLDLPIPVVAPGHSTLWDELLRIEQTTHRSEIEAVETWWRIAELNGSNWAYELAMRYPIDMSKYTPLVHYCNELRAGRRVPTTARVKSAQLGRFPYADGKYLSGGSIGIWATEGVIAEPGDVLIAGVGYRSNARIATERMIVGTDIYVLRLKEPHLATALTAYLNGQEGYDQRQLRLSGAVIQRVLLRDLKQLGVNESRLSAPNIDIQPSLDLALRLDAVLWN
jgi:hypothetical protein